jgi:cyclophilin family peptidyl-prolyl cis-trans isomerase
VGRSATTVWLLHRILAFFPLQETTMAEQQEALVQCGTTKGPFTIRLVRKWSPLGYDRAVALFQRRFYDYSHFFRTVHDFLVQFGISYTTDEDLRRFANTPIRDDPQLDPPIPFGEGTLSYAGSGPNSRTSQLFIAYDKVPSLVRYYFPVCVKKRCILFATHDFAC